jgi:transposase
MSRRPIWFGGEGRKESDMAMFYSFLGQQQSQKINIAVLDMWKPFSLLIF